MLGKIIKSKHVAFWVTVFFLSASGSFAYNHYVAEPETKAAIAHSIDSLGTVHKSQNEQILNELKSMNKDLSSMNKNLEEIKKDLNQTNQNVLDVYRKRK